jgi:hypothetical protein
MNTLPAQLQDMLHHVRLFHKHVRVFHKNVSDFTGVIAGLASAIAVLFGLVAAHYGPHGFGKLTVMMHLHRAPLIVRLSPIVTGIAIFIATVSALLRFYSWCRDHLHLEGSPDPAMAAKHGAPVNAPQSILGHEEEG